MSVLIVVYVQPFRITLSNKHIQLVPQRGTIVFEYEIILLALDDGWRVLIFNNNKNNNELQALLLRVIVALHRHPNVYESKYNRGH